MAHMIENNEMAWVGARPWHGLGVEVAPGATGAEMLKAAGLDWKVEMRDLAFMLPGVTGEMVEPLGIYKAVTRSDNDRVFAVPTRWYQPMQNEDVVDFFREYCEAGHATMETVGALKGGAIVWALAKLDTASQKIMGVDELRGYLLLATAHDCSMGTIGRATQTRVVCWNTLSAALRGKAKREFKMSHIRKWTPTMADEARSALGMAADQVAQTNAVAEALAKVQVDSDGWLQFMNGLLGADAVKDKKGQLTRTAEAIKTATITSPGSDLPTAKGTLWGVVNGVTYFADHQRGKAQDSRLAAAWFGEGDRLKNDALEVAVQMAGLAV